MDDGWGSVADHPYTFGFLVCEVVKRITGKSLGRFFADEVAGPLGLSAWIGWPVEFERRADSISPLQLPQWTQTEVL